MQLEPKHIKIRNAFKSNADNLCFLPFSASKNDGRLKAEP